MPTINRLRRGASDPVSLDYQRIDKSKTHKLPHDLEERVLHVHRTRWTRIDPDVSDVRRRIVSAILKVDGQHAGSFQFNEYRLPPLSDNSDFLECADGCSAQMYELAELLCGAWEDLYEITDCGTILDLTRAWMSPGFSGEGRFKQAATFLVSLHQDWAVLILKAFPLEYEGQNQATPVSGLRPRQLAMMRHYKSVLGVAPLPGLDGDEGWMYRLRAGLSDWVSDPVPRIC